MSSTQEITPAQRQHMFELARTFNMAKCGELSLTRFWTVFLEDWGEMFIVPDLIERGTLPPEANVDGVLTDAQLALVEDEWQDRFESIKRAMEEEWLRWKGM